MEEGQLEGEDQAGYHPVHVGRLDRDSRRNIWTGDPDYKLIALSREY